MNSKKNEVKAGAFIVFCVLILIAFLFSISGIDFKSEKTTYRARFKYIGGISKGSLVRYGGMEVGNITEIRVPDDGDSRIELVIEVKSNTPVKTDSKAFLTTIGFMGAYYLEITMGTIEAPLVEANTLITSMDITPFSQMAGSAGQITGSLELFLDRLNDLLNEKNRDAFGSLMQNTNALLSTENGNMAVLFNNLNTLTLQLKSTLETMNLLIEKNEKSLAKGIEGVPEVVEHTKSVLESLEKTTYHLDQMVMANSENYAEIIKNLQRTTQNLEEFTRTIKERPWMLVRKSAP